jgi:hypothetical protein
MLPLAIHVRWRTVSSNGTARAAKRSMRRGLRIGAVIFHRLVLHDHVRVIIAVCAVLAVNTHHCLSDRYAHAIHLSAARALGIKLPVGVWHLSAPLPRTPHHPKSVCCPELKSFLNSPHGIKYALSLSMSSAARAAIFRQKPRLRRQHPTTAVRRCRTPSCSLARPPTPAPPPSRCLAHRRCTASPSLCVHPSAQDRIAVSPGCERRMPQWGGRARWPRRSR